MADTDAQPQDIATLMQAMHNDLKAFRADTENNFKRTNKKITKLRNRVDELERSQTRMQDRIEFIDSTISARDARDGKKRVSLPSGPSGAGVGEDYRSFRDEYPYRR